MSCKKSLKTHSFFRAMNFQKKNHYLQQNPLVMHVAGGEHGTNVEGATKQRLTGKSPDGHAEITRGAWTARVAFRC